MDPTGHSWFKKFWGQIVSAVVGVAVTVATGGNFALGFQAYNLTSAAIGAGQALANGASPGRVIGALAAGAAISAAGAGIGIGNISNLGFRIAAFAEIGALSGAASAGIMGTSVGQGAAGGAAFGAATGFITSQQVGNWQAGRGFVSNEQYAALQQAKLGQGSNAGTVGLYSTKGHSFLGLTDREGNNPIFRGKYPQGAGSGNRSTVNAKWMLGKTGIGQLINEETMPGFSAAQLVAKWPVNDGQYSAIYSHMQGDPGTFALTTNCSAWALQGLREGGIRAPSNLTTFGLTDPAKVIQWDGNNGSSGFSVGSKMR